MNVIVYTTATCPWCHRAKEYLRSHNVPFKEVRVDIDQKGAQEMIRISHQMGVPVIVINGKVIIGFDKNKINSLLNIKE